MYFICWQRSTLPDLYWLYTDSHYVQLKQRGGENFSADLILAHRVLNSRTRRQEADGDQVQIWLKSKDFKCCFQAMDEPSKCITCFLKVAAMMV